MLTKIKQLMIESGLSDDAATQLCEHLETYETQLNQKYETQFKARLDAAKRVCMEEVKDHKTALTNKVQIFIESRQTTIDETLRRSAVNERTAAEAALEQIHNLLEGVNIDGQPNSELKAKLTKLENVVKTLKEERDKAVAKANSSLEMANKVLTHNRKLERSLRESTNSRVPAQKPEQQPNRIDESRSGGQPRTTRKTLQANQAKGGRETINEGRNQQQTNQLIGPAEIAASMDVNA